MGKKEKRAALWAALAYFGFSAAGLLYNQLISLII